MPVLIQPVKGERQKHFRRWGRRWSTVAADSFHRLDQLDLGTLDTGHDWSVRTTAPARWEVRSQRARATDDSGVANDLRAYVALSAADVRVAASVTVNGIGTRGPGLVYRAYDDGSRGLHLVYNGLGNYDLMQYDGAVWTTLHTYAGAVLTLGSTHLLEARVLGSTHEAWLDGAQLGTYGPDATYSTYSRVGLYNNSYNLFASNEFLRFRAGRYVG